jgi:DNA-binding NarL/FixJ family response regulator
LTDTVAAIRIFLIDDHTLFRESLLRLLRSEPGLKIVGDCATLAEGRALLAEQPVDLLLLDYDLGSETGTDLLQSVHALAARTGNPIRVLMLTAGMTASATLHASGQGLSGIVLKHSGTRQLLEAIHAVCAGSEYWDPGLMRTVLARSGGKTEVLVKARELTERQRTVLRGILDGLTNKEIAANLAASETAIKACIQQLFVKAGVRTRSQLVRVALEHFAADWLR